MVEGLLEEYKNLTMEQRNTKAEELKGEGNSHFKGFKYNEAINSYTVAISLLENDNKSAAILLSNRAMCHLKVENYGSAIEDGEAAIATDATFAKGYYRKGSGYYGLGKLEEAIKAFKYIKNGLKLNLDDVNLKIKTITGMVREKAFAESIRREDELDSIKPNELTVPESYKGPVIEEDTEITLELVKNAIDYLKDQKAIHKKYVWNLLWRISALLEKEDSLVDVLIPENKKFTVCGDIHGQFYDLLNIWSKNGEPSEENPYLFNGDFVDRGSFSVEVILALFLWKLYNPKVIYLNRGNHESKNMNKLYGFEGEVKHKYCEKTMSLFSHSFTMLPLGHVLNKKVLVVHGGLCAQDEVKLEQIQKINRKSEIPENGMMCDILWADPCKQNGRFPSKRGVSIQFGPDIAEKFLDDNKLELLVRSHEMKEEGYEVEANGRVITIFSAPKYCDHMTNKGAYINFNGSDMKPHFVQFEAVAHPPIPAMHYARNSMMFM